MNRSHRCAVVLAVLHTALWGQSGILLPAVKKAAFAKDVATAERLVAEYRAHNPARTLELLEAISWVGRGASFAQDWDKAERYAREAYDGGRELLKTRPLDVNPNASLPLALGAAIEVLAAVQDARGDRGSAVTFLRTEHQRYKGTSIETRIQKNLLLLTLEGKPAPVLAAADWIGPQRKTLAELKGQAVLVFFWAHWCGDCKRQLPDLVRLHTAYGNRGLTIVGPTQLYGYTARGQNATPEQEMAYLRGDYQKSHPVPSWMGVPVSSENFLNFGVSTTPTLMLIDGKGIVRMYHPGVLTYDELVAKVEPLLKPPS